MGAQIREYRNASEPSARQKKPNGADGSRASVVKAQQAVQSSPYARLTRAVSAVATFSNEDHPLTSEKEDVSARRGRHHHLRPWARRRVQLLGAQGERAARRRCARTARRSFRTCWAARRSASTGSAARRPRRSGAVSRSRARDRTRGRAALVADFTRRPRRVASTRCTSSSPGSSRWSPRSPRSSGCCPSRSSRPRPPHAEDLLPLYSFEPSPSRCSTRLLPKYVNAGCTTACSRPPRPSCRPPAGDEVGHGQRRRAHQEVHPAGQPGPPGRDHPRDQRNRRRRQRAGREKAE